MSELDGRSSTTHRHLVKQVCDERPRPDVFVGRRVQIGSGTGHSEFTANEPTANPARGLGFGSCTGHSEFTANELTANPARRAGGGSRSTPIAGRSAATWD
jgi:hypothetical protein